MELKKLILLSIRNGLMLDGLVNALKKKNPLAQIVEESDASFFNNTIGVYKPDIVVVEVRGIRPYTLLEWNDRIHEMKKTLTNSKVAIIVDDENYPESAELVKKQKSNGEIDAFFYETSGLNYLADAIISL